jgi:hypothetical protein
MYKKKLPINTGSKLDAKEPINSLQPSHPYILPFYHVLKRGYLILDFG